MPAKMVEGRGLVDACQLDVRHFWYSSMGWTQGTLLAERRAMFQAGWLESCKRPIFVATVNDGSFLTGGENPVSWPPSLDLAR